MVVMFGIINYEYLNGEEDSGYTPDKCDEFFLFSGGEKRTMLVVMLWVRYDSGGTRVVAKRGKR